MQTDYIDTIIQTPTLTSTKCKIISILLRVFLQFTTFASALFVWHILDYFLALLSLVLSFIIMGIIRSKIRNIAIPMSQSEHFYSDKEIADWFTYYELCT